MTTERTNTCTKGTIEDSGPFIQWESLPEILTTYKKTHRKVFQLFTKTSAVSIASQLSCTLYRFGTCKHLWPWMLLDLETAKLKRKIKTKHRLITGTDCVPFRQSNPIALLKPAMLPSGERYPFKDTFWLLASIYWRSHGSRNTTKSVYIPHLWRYLLCHHQPTHSIMSVQPSLQCSFFLVSPPEMH